MTDSTLTSELFHLEQQLLDPAFRRDRAAVSALLADGFVEYGSSGRIFTKTEILDFFATESAHRIEIADFAARLVALDVALVTYRALRHAESGLIHASLRSSLWIRRDHRWQLLFHQGTSIPPTNP